MSANKEPPPKRVYRSYSLEEKASALLSVDANDGNIAATALELDIPYRTLYQWANDQKTRTHPEVVRIQNEKRIPLSNRLEQIVHLIAEGMDDPDKIARAPLNQLSVAMGVLIDKIRLLRGEAPSGTPGHPHSREVPQSVLIVMDPNTPEARVASEVARLGLRRPVDFGASACPIPSPLEPTPPTAAS